MCFEQNQKIWIRPKVIAVIIAAAIHTPKKMEGIAFFSRMSSTAATKAPVQAPVPGSGIGTVCRVVRAG